MICYSRNGKPVQQVTARRSHRSGGPEVRRGKLAFLRSQFSSVPRNFRTGLTTETSVCRAELSERRARDCRLETKHSFPDVGTLCPWSFVCNVLYRSRDFWKGVKRGVARVRKQQGKEGDGPP